MPGRLTVDSSLVSERTLVLAKPDAVRRGLIGEIVARIERKGLRIAALELRTLDRETAQKHYAEHEGKPFFGDLVEFITGGPLVALVAEGPRAHEAPHEAPHQPTAGSATSTKHPGVGTR